MGGTGSRRSIGLRTRRAATTCSASLPRRSGSWTCATKPPKPPSKEAQIRALLEQKPVVVRPPAAAPPTDDVNALQALLLTLRGDPRRITGIPLDKRVTMARTCLAWLNLTLDDLRAP